MLSSFVFEREFGIQWFWTSGDGVGGRLRKDVEDFVVEEIGEPHCLGEGDFTALRVRTCDMEGHRLLWETAKAFGVGMRDVSAAGTKDRRSVSVQWITVRRRWDGRDIHIPGVEVLAVKPVGRMLRLGEHGGNMFNIVVRDLDVEGDEAVERCRYISSESMGVFPNFFGIQRFGALRPVTHRVGEAMVRGNWREAGEIFLGEKGLSNGVEAEARDAVRRAVKGNIDWEDVLSIFPHSLYLERRMIEALGKGASWEKAFSRLPFYLLQLFVHSFEGYIFNLILSRRMEEHLPFYLPVEGDLLIPRVAEFKGGRRRFIPVSSQNINRAREMVEKEMAWVSCLLPGSQCVFARGEPGEIEHEVMEEIGVREEDFIIPRFPRLTSRGTRRSAHFHPDNFSFSSIKYGLEFKFSLPPGCYATTVMREYMKKDNPLSY